MEAEVHTVSAFSFLYGASQPEDLVHRAASLGYGAVALLDRDGLYGAPRFYLAARSAGVHPVVGASLGVHVSGVTGRLGLYVETPEGYKNLSRLITLGKFGISKHDARNLGVTVALSDLAVYAAGLLVLFLSDEAPLKDIPRGDSPAVAWVRAVVGVFGRNRCYIEHGRHLLARERRTMVRLADLGRALGVPSVATNGVLYATPETAPIADVLTATRLRTTLDAAGQRLDANAERYIKSPEQLRRLFYDAPGDIAHARALAERCRFTLRDLGYRLPEFPLEPGETAIGRLRALVTARAPARFRPLDPRSRAQLHRELALIERLKLAGYFLIVWDIVRYCGEHGIMVQGRGSAANSAVCYALGITAVDPVAMNLLFERFLSEERGEWPDIDLDLPSGDRREQVIQYVYRRYGPRGAAMTANVITYRARSAVRDAGKALGFTEETLARVAKHLHWGSADPESFAVSFESAGFSRRDARMDLLIRTACGLQDLPRHLGQHSGGMIVAAGRLDDVVPLEPAAMADRVVVQWDKDDCGDLGILKIDLLGLGMMAVLEEVIPTIRAHDGVDLDLAHLPADDPETYAMLCRADTVGVFQVESRAQMATLPRLKPTKFYDLVVEVAIIRPGPIVGKMVHPYLNRRAKREPEVYPHPDLRPILERTLGIPLFQEQLMRVAMVAGGFTGGQAEELRRAMSHKRSAERMKALESDLRAGMTRNGYDQAAQDVVVRGIMSFALYGFPESHSASFALIAYASAYFKCHYPASFACALLNHWPMGFYHPATVVKDAQRHGVRVLPVDVTRSGWSCTRETDDSPGSRGALRLGLRYVTGLREDLGRAIEHARANGPFASLDDLTRRTGARQADLVSLAELGALAHLPHPDASGWTRRTALWQVEAIAARPQGGLFAHAETLVEPSPLAEMSLSERVAADYRTSGLTVGPHPMRFYREDLRARSVSSVADVLRAQDGAYVSVAGVVITRQRPATAKGFFFLTIEDETGFANAIVRPALFEAERATLVTARVILLRGLVQSQDGVTSVKVSHAEPLAVRDPIEFPTSHDFR